MDRQQNRRFQSPWRSYLSASQVESAIDAGYPVLAGISPTYAAASDGWGLSQHVVVIAGYDEVDGQTLLTVNDPYPYSMFEDPYLAAGATKTQTGQYRIRYAAFRSQLRYQNSITFDWAVRLRPSRSQAAADRPPPA